MTEKIEFFESTGNLFEDVGFEKQEAKKLQLKSYLMVALMKYIKSCNLTQVEAAKRLGVTQARISNLAHNRIDLFSTEMLLDMMQRVGFRVYEKIEIDVEQFLTKSWQQSVSKSGRSS
jgi:predicted XRE-type DNA-binding protein